LVRDKLLTAREKKVDEIMDRASLLRDPHWRSAGSLRNLFTGVQPDSDGFISGDAYINTAPSLLSAADANHDGVVTKEVLLSWMAGKK
jgi:hypothetical protein